MDVVLTSKLAPLEMAPMRINLECRFVPSSWITTALPGAKKDEVLVGAWQLQMEWPKQLTVGLFLSARISADF